MSNTTNSSSLVPLGYVGHTYVRLEKREHAKNKLNFHFLSLSLSLSVFVILQDGTGSGGYIAFLVVYMVIFLLGNYLHFKYRMYQPLRAVCFFFPFWSAHS